MAGKASIPFKLLLILLALSVLFLARPVRAEEIKDQLTILYESANHDFSEIDVDFEKIESVESVSDVIDVVHLKNKADAAEMIEEIKKSPGVRAVDHEAIAEAKSVPNDKYYQSEQNYLKRLGFENVVPGENTAKVAVVDTGVNATHEDLIGRVEESGFNYVKNSYDTTDMQGHGTFAAGLIAARTNNSIGIAGACGNADVLIVPYAVLDRRGEGKLSDITAALQAIKSRDDIKVVNMSLGFESENEVLEETCQQLADKGIILTAASGNYNDPFLCYPAGYDSVISVGAVNANDERCSPKDWGAGQGSNYGEGLDLVAPGDDVASLSGTTGYIKNSGTSFSAPLVAAACALAVTRNVNANLSSIRSAISTTSKDLATPGYDLETGYGLLQIDKLVSRFNASDPETPENPTPEKPPTPEITIELSKTNVSLYVGEETTIEAHVNVPATVTWTSSNPLVASVSNGQISALSEGTAVITARLRNGKSADCQVTVKNRDLTYQAHTANIGWMGMVKDGEMAGTTGQNRALEALRFNVDGVTINAVAHVQNLGWMDPVSSSGVVGTTGRALHMEAIRLTLDEKSAQKYRIYYRVHVQNYGWTAWAHDGYNAGTEGHNLQLEAVEVRLIPYRGDLPSSRGDVSWTFMR